MDLSKIITISGKPGLFLLKSQGRGNMVVESLLDGKTMAAFSHNKLSLLEDISIYTTTDSTALKEVFMAIHNTMGDKLDFNPKEIAPEALKAKFKAILPEYDETAVYVSDMRKVFAWYQLLVDKNLLDFTVEEEKKEDKPEEDAK